MKAFKAFALAAAISFTFGPSPGAGAFLDHWNSGTGGKPSRNGLAWERGPTNATVLWKGSLDALWGSQAVVEGNIAVMTRANFATFDRADVLHGSRIVAHNLTTGEILWTNSLPIDFPETDWSDSVKGIRDGRVYATRASSTNPGYFYALDARTGAILWRSEFAVATYGTECPSFAPDGDLIVGEFTRLTRIHAVDGTRLWSVPRITPATGGGEPAVFGTRAYIWYGAANTLRVAAFNLATGAFLYSIPIGAAAQQAAVFVGPDGTVYAPLSTSAGYLIALQDTGSAFVEKWRVPMGYVPFSSFGVGPDGSIYSYSRDYRVLRINHENGAILNASEILSANYHQPRMLIDSTGILFVTNGSEADQGALYSYNPDLTLRWTAPVANVAYGGPAIGKNGTLVVCGAGTDVTAYRGNSEGWPGPPLQLSRQGAMIVITFSGRLQSVGVLSGTWTDVPGATSPWLVSPGESKAFYRSLQE